MAIAAARLVPDPLRRLGLTDEELSALQQQGTITCELRGRATYVCRLSFRIGGCQRTRYLGVEGPLVDALRAALAEWQRPCQTARDLGRLDREAGQRLREQRCRVAEALHRHGYGHLASTITRSRRVNIPFPEASSQVINPSS